MRGVHADGGRALHGEVGGGGARVEGLKDDARGHALHRQLREGGGARVVCRLCVLVMVGMGRM